MNYLTKLLLLLLCGACATTTKCPSPAVPVIQNGVWLDTVMEPINLSKDQVCFIVMHWEPRSTINPLFQICTGDDTFYTTGKNVAALIGSEYTESNRSVDLGSTQEFAYVEIYYGPNDVRSGWVNNAKMTMVAVSKDACVPFAGKDDLYIAVCTCTLYLPDGRKWFEYLHY